MNGSTGNPQPSSTVTLLDSSGECGHAITNDSGEFRIVPKLKSCGRPSGVLKATFDGVDYFQPVTAGHAMTFAVYQSAGLVNPISSSLSLLQFQSVGQQLEVTELHALNNLSSPQMTQVNPDNFVLSIPPSAQIEPAVVSSPDGGTTKIPLVSVSGSADQYRIDFPIKPGTTKFAIRYALPYDAASFVFRRRIQYAIDRIGVIIPKSMHLRSISPDSFHPITGTEGNQEQQFELDETARNTTVAFALSGTGELAHSFRPLEPAEHVAAKERIASTISAPQTKGAFPANGISTSERSRPIGLRSLVVLAFLLLSAVLVWFLVRRSKAAMSSGGHS